MAIVHPIAARKNLQLKFSIERSVPKWLLGDDARLRQVLLNLLNNAVKFTEAGSISIDVRRQSGPDGRERIRFAITDTGVGIPIEHQHRLFKQFSQADGSVSRRHGGTGLGLAICKRLVELMEGEIGVVSDFGMGATLWFTAYLPQASKPAEESEIDLPLDDMIAIKAKILLVDDLDTNREIVEAYLEDNGYLVTSGASRVLYANPAYRALGGASGAARNVERLFSGAPEISEAIYRLSQAARTGGSAVEEVRLSPPLTGSGADVLVIAATPKFAAQAIRKSADLGFAGVRYLSYVSPSISAVL